MWSAMVAPMALGSAPLPPVVLIKPAGGLGAEVRSFTCGIRTLRPEGGSHRVDDALVAVGSIGVSETPPLHRPRLEVGDHDVGVFRSGGGTHRARSGTLRSIVMLRFPRL